MRARQLAAERRRREHDPGEQGSKPNNRTRPTWPHRRSPSLIQENKDRNSAVGGATRHVPPSMIQENKDRNYRVSKLCDGVRWRRMSPSMIQENKDRNPKYETPANLAVAASMIQENKDRNPHRDQSSPRVAPSVAQHDPGEQGSKPH